MSRNYKIRDQEKLYFISFATVNWIDVFIRREYKDIIVDSLNFCVENKGLEYKYDGIEAEPAYNQWWGRLNLNIYLRSTFS